MKTIQETITPSIHQSISFPVLSCMATLFQNQAMFTSSPQGFGSEKQFKSQLFAQSWPCSPSFQWCAQGWWWFSNRSSSTSPGAWRSCATRNSPGQLGVAPNHRNLDVAWPFCYWNIVKHIFQPMVLGCFGNNQLCEIPIQSNSIIKTMDLAMKHGDWPSTSINNYGEWGLKHGSLDIDFLPVIPSGKLT